MALQKITFNYSPNFFTDRQTGGSAIVYRPLVPVKLAYKRTNNVLIWSLLDSGADRNLFPAVFGLQVGLDIRKGIKSEIAGIGGYKISIYTCEVKVFVVGSTLLTFDTEIDFSYDHQIPILGRNGFFDLFEKVEFSERKKLIELTL